MILEHLGYVEPVRVCDVCYQKRTPSNGPLTDLCEELAEEVSQKHYCDVIILCIYPQNGFQVLQLSSSECLTKQC